MLTLTRKGGECIRIGDDVRIVIREVRGMALMTGIELAVEGKEIYEECLKKGLLINCTQAVVLRIMPPLTVTKKEIDTALKILDAAVTSCAK